MLTRRFSLVVCSLFFAITLVFTAAAQTNQGSIAGNVSDPSGAMVPNAKIMAKDVNTGATYQTVSSSAGAYRLPNVNIGSYDVTANAPGFKSATLTGVVVEIATTSALDIKLQTGTVTENVVVNANAPTVQTESSDIGTVVGDKQILDLPLALGSTVQAMRSPEAFAFLTPGVVGPGSDSGNGGTFESKISGGQNYATEVLLDGAATTRSENGSSFDETAPSVEALGEFKILTSTIPAEFGRTTGGVESFNTKSGTNNYHGDIYEIFRNEDLDANVWGNDYCLTTNDPRVCTAPRSSYARPLDRQNDYGGTFGGPVVIPHLYNGKDKTFFFFSWEQYQQTQGGVNTSTVPTQAERTGDFSDQLVTSNVVATNPCDGTPIFQGEIFDPATTRPGPGGLPCRTAFLNEAGSTGNVIPSNRLSTVGKNIMGFYPSPQNGNLINNYVFAYSFPIEDTTTTFRIDQNISEKSKAYFTYSSRENTRNSTPGSITWNNPAGSGRTQFFGTHYIRFGYDYTFTPTLLDHVSLGYNRTNSKNVGNGVSQGKGQDWAQTLGITGGPVGPMFPAIGQTNVSGMGDAVDGDTIDNGFRFSNTLNWVHGKHELKFGYEQWYQQYSPLNFQNTSGTFNFAAAQTAADQTDPLNGNSVASMLLGDPTFANYTVYHSQARWLRSYFAGFVQDNFKVTPTLTFNFGLRYEIDQPFKEAHGNTSNISLTAPNPAAGNLPGATVFAGVGSGRNGNVNERWANTYFKDFGPRFGFAWSPAFLGTGKTVFRGGYGIIYGGLQYADFGGFGLTGFQASPGFSSNGFDPAFSLDTGVPAANVTLPNTDPSQQNFTGPTYLDPSYGRPPMIQNWSFEIQRQLATDLIADVAYVGQHSTHLRSNYDAVNSLNPKYFSMGTNLLTPIGNQSAVPLPFTNFPTGDIVAQALVPFPQYFGFNTDGQLENLGQSTYNALEAQLTRRFHNGLNLMASYTWSKTLTNADAALPFFATLHQGGAPQDPFDKSNDKSVSNQDLPQNFVVSYVYELPVGKGKHFLDKGGALDRIVGGWSISGVQRYESGQPLAFGCATGVPAFAGCIRFDQVSGSSILSSAFKSGHWNPVTDSVFNSIDLPGAINPAAFADPNSPANVAARGNVYTFGTMPRVNGAVRMYPFLSEDFTLMKRTKLTESKDLLLQVNLLNAFNRHIWNRPEDLNPYDSVTSPTNPIPAFGVMQVTNFSNAGGGSYLLLPRKLQLQLKFEF